MKAILLISLLINIVLALITAWRGANSAPIPRVTRAEVGESDGGTRPATSSKLPAASQAPAPWQQIDSDDIHTFIANLRGIGCPERTIRDIVVFRVSRKYYQRMMEKEAARAQESGFRGQDQAKWRESVYDQRDLRNELKSELEAALGLSWEELHSSVTGSPTFGFDMMQGMSFEQRRTVREIKTQIEREEGALAWQRLTGDLSLEEEARLRELDRKKREQLARVLSPKQLEEYLYRDSSAADYVRRNLPQSGSEEEFRAAVRLAQEMEMHPVGNDLHPTPSESDELAAEMKRRTDLFNERLKELLGEQRTAEREAEAQARLQAEQELRARERDEAGSRGMTRQLTTAGATPEQAEQFVARLKELQPELQARFAEIEKNLTGTPEEKQNSMKAAVKAEFTRIAVETMGEQATRVVDQLIQQIDGKSQ